MQFLMALLEHPVLLVILLMFFMGFVGMTYEFILRMCKKPPFLDAPIQNDEDNEDGGEAEPPEPANVPKPPTEPDGELKGAAEIPDGAEEVEDEDGNLTVEYTYTTLPNNFWEKNWDKNKQVESKEGVH